LRFKIRESKCSDANICMCLLTFLARLYEVLSRVRMQHVHGIRSSKSDVMQSCFFLCTPNKTKSEWVKAVLTKEQEHPFIFADLSWREKAGATDVATDEGTDVKRPMI
jgi:hypothetical protein